MEEFGPAPDPRLVDPRRSQVRAVEQITKVEHLSFDLLIELGKLGEEGAEEWAQGVVNNMARDPQGGDTDQIRAVAAGECNLAVGNHYYYARLLNSDDVADREVAREVGIIFPNQDGRGVHAYIGGAGVVATAPNRDNAVRFLEFLSSDTAQQIFAESNHEFPAVDGVLKNPVLDSWGNLNIDDINVSVLGTNNPEAVKIFDRVGWR